MVLVILLEMETFRFNTRLRPVFNHMHTCDHMMIIEQDMAKWKLKKKTIQNTVHDWRSSFTKWNICPLNMCTASMLLLHVCMSLKLMQQTGKTIVFYLTTFCVKWAKDYFQAKRGFLSLKAKSSGSYIFYEVFSKVSVFIVATFNVA